MFWEILKILQIRGAESIDKLIIKVKNVENESDIEGNGRNVTRILGHFIMKFMKEISKTLPIPGYLLEILTKPSKKFIKLEETKAENLLWRQKLKFEEFFKWVKDINLKQKITLNVRTKLIRYATDRYFKNRCFYDVLSLFT